MFSSRIHDLAADRVSGAAEILRRAIEILRDALAAHADMVEVTRAVVGAQPSMAPVWNAALAALAARDDPGRFDRFAGRIARAPEALARAASEVFGPDVLPVGGTRSSPSRESPPAGGRPLQFVTISFSGSVLAVLEAVRRTRPVEVVCSESRPANEGRALAARLAAGGIPVTCVLDAAIGQSLAAADAVLVGADAITAGWFVNKAGTKMLAAAASTQGVPVYVVASRDKFACAGVAARLTLGEGSPADVWRDPPPGVVVRNVCFETIPFDLVRRLITDDGVLDVGTARQVCEALDGESPAALVSLIGGPQ